MHKKLLILIIMLFAVTLSAEVSYVESCDLVNSLEKNKKTDVTICSKVDLKGFVLNQDGSIKIPSIKSEKIKLIANLETEGLAERIKYKNRTEYIVFFELKEIETKTVAYVFETIISKTYAITSIQGIETISEYKNRLEKEKLEAEKLVEKKKLNEKNLVFYNEYLAKAKKYEKEKSWCFALDAYYDAMGLEIDPELKSEACRNFIVLSNLIFSGNPGIGNYDEFTLYDEWEKLLVDAEKYSKSNVLYQTISIGELYRENVDYTSKTGNYKAYVSYGRSHKELILQSVKDGFDEAKRDGWEKLSYENVDIKENSIKFKYNLVDENGKEILSPRICNDREIVLESLPIKIIELIDSKKVFINPLAYYCNDIEIPIEKVLFSCWPSNEQNTVYINFCNTILNSPLCKKDMKIIPYMNIKVLETEVTQELYVSIMGENPSSHLCLMGPVEDVSWYDAIYFCNKLSVSRGLKPVYSVNGETDVTKWNYTPHRGTSIKGEIKQNTYAKGYRLPTVEEWQLAAKGGEYHTYSGSDKLDEVGWYCRNSNEKTHPVAQKKANRYGLYDMSGNVFEWCWDESEYIIFWANPDYTGMGRVGCGGWADSYEDDCKVADSPKYATNPRDTTSNCGFRILCKE